VSSFITTFDLSKNRLFEKDRIEDTAIVAPRYWSYLRIWRALTPGVALMFLECP
jgi:hypothetical protein